MLEWQDYSELSTQPDIVATLSAQQAGILLTLLADADNPDSWEPPLTDTDLVAITDAVEGARAELSGGD